MKINELKFKFDLARAIINYNLHLHKKELTEWNFLQPIFIISTGRTGTHFFSHFFSNNFNLIYSAHEPVDDLFYLNIHYAKKDISINHAKLMLNSYRKNILINAIRNNFLFYIESNNNLSYLIPIIREVVPNYKIVYIQRNGIDYVRSAYSMKVLGKATKIVPFLSSDDNRDRLNAKSFINDPYFEKWNEMSRFEKICWYWTKINCEIINQIKNDPNTIVFRFEKLFNERSMLDWDTLIDFLGLDKYRSGNNIKSYIQNNQSNNSNHYELDEWKSWSIEQKQVFNEISGILMKEMGYWE